MAFQLAKNKFLGSYFTLRYLSLDHITQILSEFGPQALIYKIVISRVFRHLRIDPGDLDLLGIKHKDYYIDGTLPFGFRLGLVFFQHCSDAIQFIMKQHGFNNLFNYIDDLIYVGLPHKILKSFKFLQELLLDLGVEITSSKLVPPTKSAVCLGILVDIMNKNISIPTEKLSYIKQ